MANNQNTPTRVTNVRGEVARLAPATKKLFSQNLRFIMAQHGVSNIELARIVNVSENTICYWRAGTRYPTATALQALASYFGISQSDFFDANGTAGTVAQAELTNKRGVVVGGTSESQDGALVRAFVMKENSMLPFIQPADNVIYRLYKAKEQPKEESLAVVRLDGVLTVRRVFYIGGKVALVATDKRFPPSIFDLDSKDFEFVGAPTSIQRNISML